MRRSQTIIALTPELKRQFELRHINKVKVITNAVDVAEFTDMGESDYILTAGRLVEHKGFQYLLRAYASIAPTINDKLVIIGSGPYGVQLKTIAKELEIKGRVTFRPFLPRNEYLSYL